ncbi:hypothetical protein GCM10027614_12190 [Micromonospora vulcania]
MTSSPTRHTTAAVTAVHRIGDSAPHSAFTDLVRHSGSWFCAFREARTHLSDDGVIRVLTSTDGRSWRSAAVVRQEGVDLRDPRFVRGRTGGCNCWPPPPPARAPRRSGR